MTRHLPPNPRALFQSVSSWVFLCFLAAIAIVPGCASPVADTVGGQPDAAPGKPRVALDAAVLGLPVAVTLPTIDAEGVAIDATAAPPAPPALTDFPAEPVYADVKVPVQAELLFEATPRTNGAPCIISPEPNTLMPRNWLRPRFDFLPAADENLFEIQLSVEGFAHALRIYTGQRSYVMDAALWGDLRVSVVDKPILVEIRALTVDATGKVKTAPSAKASSHFRVAPVEAPGKIVYWAILAGKVSGVLKGFGIGEEGVVGVLEGKQLLTPAVDRAKQDVCVGCHSATPDGLAVGFSMGGTYWFRNSMADITDSGIGQKPAYVTDGQMAAVRKLMGIPSYSKAHWSDGDHISLLMDGASRGNLMWVNLDTDGEQGTIARTGDSKGAVLPSFSHDGTRIAYVSSNSIRDGRLGSGPADIFVVPYGDRQGGPAAAVQGASDPKFTEYYPAYSPDDAYIAFARVAGNADSYSNPNAEILVVPAEGGTATRFAANDPVACGKGLRSPGVGNDWPKWSPDVVKGADGRTYYWITFSSVRSGRPQLFLTAMTVSGGVVDASYPALYLWNQPTTENNHTPSWDNYQIPAAPPAPPSLAPSPPPIVL